jgi:hypothetical protein
VCLRPEFWMTISILATSSDTEAEPVPICCWLLVFVDDHIDGQSVNDGYLPELCRRLRDSGV